MKNFRLNPITGQWVIVAEGRELRPNEFALNHVHRPKRRCPFCAGHEDDTPGEVAALDASGNPTDGDDWLVRVVPNKFPVLRYTEPFFEEAIPDLCLAPQASKQDHVRSNKPQVPTLDDLSFRSGGIHELIVESARHVSSFSDLTDDESTLSLVLYQLRLLRLQERGLSYGMVFKNCRPDAGASIDHVHSQLIGTPMVPSRVIEQYQRCRDFAVTYGQSIAAWTQEQERACGERILLEQDDFWAFCPYASHMMFEVWIMPRDPALGFLDLNLTQTASLSLMTKRIVAALESILELPPYNFTLQLPPFVPLENASPVQAPNQPSGNVNFASVFPWRLEITPRLNKTAGFEWGTGCMILAISPEAAASRLREALG